MLLNEFVEEPVESIVSVPDVAVKVTVPLEVKLLLLSQDPDTVTVLDAAVKVPSISISCVATVPPGILPGLSTKRRWKRLYQTSTSICLTVIATCGGINDRNQPFWW